MALAGLMLWTGAAMGDPVGMSVTPVLQGPYGDYASGLVLVRHTAAGWDQAMRGLALNHKLLYGSTWTSDDLQKDGVRWGAESVLLIALGQMPTTEWQVSVDHLEGHANHLLVVVRLVDGPALQSESSPYLVARVPAGNWEYVDVQYVGVAGPQIQSLGGEPALLTLGAQTPDQVTMTWGGLKAEYNQR
jgi:hypothetical protein